MRVINIGFACYKIVEISQFCRTGYCDRIPEAIRRKNIEITVFLDGIFHKRYMKCLVGMVIENGVEFFQHRKVYAVLK